MSRRSRPHYHSGLEWILGVAFEDTLTRPARLAQGFTSVRCCGAPRASSPHGLAAPALASHDGRDCVQLPPARGCYHLAPRRTFTSNPVPMPGTRRVGAKDYSSAPLTEPDVRATHPALWIDISEVQRELNRNLRRVKVVPQGFERGHPSGEPCRRIGSRHCPNVGLHPCAGVGTDRFLALRFLQQKVSRRGCVRALSLSVPRRAVGEHEAQLPGSRLSQSISSLAPLAFTSLLATMRRSDFCVGVVPSSLPPSGLPLEADTRRPPWVMTLDVPPLPPPLPLRPRMDFGRRVRRHADPAGPACSGVHSRSVLRFASGFFPTRPRGASAGVSRRQGLRAVASSSRLLPPRPATDFHLQSSAHARHTFALLAVTVRPADSLGRKSSAAA